eukprot:scaffold1670_cov121-Skeletonema_dohrnii-CCMP3373.AAC.3
MVIKKRETAVGDSGPGWKAPKPEPIRSPTYIPTTLLRRYIITNCLAFALDCNDVYRSFLNHLIPC